MSDLAQRLGVPPSSLQRELLALTQAGIWSERRTANRVYYQTNAAFPLLPELQSLFAKTVGLAEQVKDALKPFWEDIDLAFIFGSVARVGADSAERCRCVDCRERRHGRSGAAAARVGTVAPNPH